MQIPVYRIKVLGYHVRRKPNHTNIGAKVDRVIKKHFLGQNVAIRCLGSREHGRKSADDIIKIIKKLGTDKYDPNRKGEKYENVDNKRIDFFALDFKIANKGRYMESFIESFYTYPKQDKKQPVRIDIVIIYNMSKLKRVVHRYEGRTDIKRDGFVFKDPQNKPGAVKGIIRVL